MGMSAVEVLEWMRNSDNMIILFGSSVDYTLVDYTPQEIVNRIEKYEAEKNLEDYDEETCKSHCRISAISDSDCADYCNMKCPHVVSEENHIVEDDERVEQKNDFFNFDVPPVRQSEPEFKVGDWVRHKISGNIAEVIGIDEKGYEIDNGHLIGYIGCLDEFEHALPPKPTNEEVEQFFVEARSMAEPPKEKSAKVSICSKCGCVLFDTDAMCPDCLTPKEEKQKIEKLPISVIGDQTRNTRLTNAIVDLLDELVDAVNELRGV